MKRPPVPDEAVKRLYAQERADAKQLKELYAAFESIVGGRAELPARGHLQDAIAAYHCQAAASQEKGR